MICFDWRFPEAARSLALAGATLVWARARRPRVAEWAHDKDKDWRQKPILYR